MTAGEYNFNYDQGTTLTFLITYQDDQGTGIDLTGYTYAGQIKQKITDTASIADLVVEAETPASGIIRVTIPATALSSLKFTGATSFKSRVSVLYDIEMTSPTGDVTRLLNGTISVSPEVTR
jgi:hypothetical protein